eukprot:3582467-Amphidinium_carterae.1
MDKQQHTTDSAQQQEKELLLVCDPLTSFSGTGFCLLRPFSLSFLPPFFPHLIFPSWGGSQGVLLRGGSSRA